MGVRGGGQGALVLNCVSCTVSKKSLSHVRHFLLTRMFLWCTLVMWDIINKAKWTISLFVLVLNVIQTILSEIIKMLLAMAAMVLILCKLRGHLKQIQLSLFCCPEVEVHT